MYDAERTDQKRISLSGIPKTVWQLILRHSGLGIWMLSYFRSYYKLTEDTENNNTILIFTFSAIAYTLMIYITDNVLLYFEYWFPLNLMLLDMAHSRPSDVKRQSLLMKAHYLYD